MATILSRSAALTLVCATTAALAQPAGDEPFWAQGRPKSGEAARMAPVPGHSTPTSADKLPIAKFKLPAGFVVEPWVTGVLDARGLRQGDQGTVFVSTLFAGNKIYAIDSKNPRREVKTLIDKMPIPTGIEFYKGALYVATPKQVIRYDNIETRLDNPGKPVVVYDKLPGDTPHGWKYLRIHGDKLYLAIGAPCNICDPGDTHAKIIRMSLDGSGVETVARGVRNTVGFDFDPKTGDLWFTDNGRDWLGEDLPHDELNHLTALGQHFGYPYCHQGNVPDPEFGKNKNCKDYRAPVALLGPHAAALGMTFYQGKMFPARYQGAIFIARHGPWNRSIKYADIALAWPDGRGGITKVEPFMTGFVENNHYLARPVDLLVLKDGSMLVSDDHNGAIYRISYNGG